MSSEVTSRIAGVNGPARGSGPAALGATGAKLPRTLHVVHSVDGAGPTTTIRVHDDLDAAGADALDQTWSTLQGFSAQSMHLDLGGVRSCSAAGLQALTRIAADCRASQTSLQITVPAAMADQMHRAGLTTAARPAGSLRASSHHAGERPEPGGAATDLLRGVRRLVAVTGAGQDEIVNTLIEVATDLPGADSFHVALSAPGERHVRGVGHAGPLGDVLASAEAALGQGPGPSSRSEAADVHVPDLHDADAAHRWPRLVALSEIRAVRTVLCLHLGVPARDIGTLTLTSPHPAALSQTTQEAAAVLAGTAAVVLAGEREGRQMVEAISHRDLIGQAKGVLMERHRITSDIAFAVLKTASNETNTKLHLIAATVAETGDLTGTYTPPAEHR